LPTSSAAFYEGGDQVLLYFMDHPSER